MTLDEFLKKHKVKLGQTYIKLCREGERRMKNNPDPHHAYSHICNLLDNLDALIKFEKLLREKSPDFEVLLPAICWHDTWKGSHTQTRSVFVLMYREIYDAIGSSKLYKKHIEKNKFTVPKYDEIKYCIKKHGRWSQALPRWIEDVFFPVETIEARIICDIDSLDAWSLERISVIKENYINNEKEIDSKLIPIGKFWFQNMMWNANGSHYFFEYSKKEFLKRKNEVFQEICNIWNNLDQLIDVTDPDIVKKLKVRQNILDELDVKDYYSLAMAKR